MTMTALEMFNELVAKGFIVSAPIEPSRRMIPTAYVSVPTSTGYFSPPVHVGDKKRQSNAKLGKNRKRNTRGKRRDAQ